MSNTDDNAQLWQQHGADGHSAAPLTLLDAIRRFRASHNILFALILFVLYLFVGAAVFSSIETPGHVSLIEELKTERASFLEDHKECMTNDELEELITRIVDADDRGISAMKNASGDLHWGFGQAFFFSGAVISTVGFGHTTPVTPGGKLFTMLYALVGIPLTLLFITAIVARLQAPSMRLKTMLNERFGHRFRSPSSIDYLHFGVLSSLVFFCFFIIPSACFASWEDWTFIEAFYYCFVSLTTISLGDFIPGDGQEHMEGRQFYKFLNTIYLLTGLTFMLLLLTTLYDIPQLNLRKWFAPDQQQEQREELTVGHSEDRNNGTSAAAEGAYISSVENSNYNYQY